MQYETIWTQKILMQFWQFWDHCDCRIYFCTFLQYVSQVLYVDVTCRRRIWIGFHGWEQCRWRLMMQKLSRMNWEICICNSHTQMNSSRLFRDSSMNLRNRSVIVCGRRVLKYAKSSCKYSRWNLKVSLLLLARLMGNYCFARWCLSSSVGVCNTPRWACRRLQQRRRGDDVMPPPV